MKIRGWLHATAYTRHTSTHTMNRKNHPKTRIKQFTVSVHTPRTVIAMPPKKADFVEELLALGEVAPPKWTIPELKVRIAELKEEKGLPMIHRKTELQQWVTKLNKASSKKVDLQHFLTHELQMSVNPNWTILQLQRHGMEKIYDLSPADGSDPVGFGAHSAKSYEEVMLQEPEYVTWAITSMKEGDCSTRLRRLGKWLEEQQTTKTDKIKTKGYTTSPKKTPAPAASSSAVPAELTTVLQGMMQQMSEIKEELEEVRGRPHKKSAKDDDVESNTQWSLATPR